ncbi:LysR substrate-binding domain-containing protein, partial [Salmonella sp. M36]|uniref:LysR substrate-binding domain-containing protein n=1 Tax=Salmonella sp. M36 TaxID=3240314 RepID=UPI00352BB98B
MVGFTETGDRLPQVPHVERLAQGRYAFRSNSLLAQLQALRQGYGLGMTSCFLADPDPGLVRVLTTEVGYHFDAWAVVHRDLRQSPRIR